MLSLSKLSMGLLCRIVCTSASGPQTDRDALSLDDERFDAASFEFHDFAKDVLRILEQCPFFLRSSLSCQL